MVEEFLTEFAKGYCERASDQFWPPGGGSRHKRITDQSRGKTHQTNIKQTTLAMLISFRANSAA
jgi:hypothetical protein